MSDGVRLSINLSVDEVAERMATETFVWLLYDMKQGIIQWESLQFERCPRMVVYLAHPATWSRARGVARSRFRLEPKGWLVSINPLRHRVGGGHYKVPICMPLDVRHPGQLIDHTILAWDIHYPVTANG